MDSQTIGRGVGMVVVLSVVALTGCASNMEHIAAAMAERQPQRCTFTDREGVTETYEGPICENIARAKLQVEAYSACGTLAQENEPMCVLAIALGGSGSNDRSRTSDETQLLIAAMNNDTQITAAWISQIPLVGTVASSYFSYKSNQDLYNTFEAGLKRSGTMNITQSNDGGGAEGGGRGGDGDLLVFNGDSAQSINRGEGNAISDGRNPVFMGLNNADSSFETSNSNQNNAPDATNNNSPAVQTSDDDGGQSIIPDFL